MATMSTIPSASIAGARLERSARALAVLLMLVGCADGALDGWPSGRDGALPEVSAPAPTEPVEAGVPMAPAPDAPDAGAGSGVAGASSGGAASPDGTCARKIVVNEVQVEGGSMAADEFIELYNPGACEVAVGGFAVEVRSRSGASLVVIHRFAPGARLAPKAHFVLAGVSFGGPRDVVVSHNLDPSAGQIAILDAGGAVIDAVGYGATTTGPFVEKTPAQAPPGGSSIARKAGGQDTDDNAADFRVVAPSPRAPNP